MHDRTQKCSRDQGGSGGTELDLKYSHRTLKSLMIMPNGFENISAFVILVNHDFGEPDFRCAYGATENQYILVSNSVFCVLFRFCLADLLGNVTRNTTANG